MKICHSFVIQLEKSEHRKGKLYKEHAVDFYCAKEYLQEQFSGNTSECDTVIISASKDSIMQLPALFIILGEIV